MSQMGLQQLLERYIMIFITFVLLGFSIVQQQVFLNVCVYMCVSENLLDFKYGFAILIA